MRWRARTDFLGKETEKEETKSEKIVTGNRKNTRKMFYSGKEAFVSHGLGSREISRKASQAFIVARTHTGNFHPQLLQCLTWEVKSDRGTALR